ncbi:MAG: 5'-nucleotidase C-terminal domain-containing protein [Aristaeellaceae bacterium]
MKFKQLFPRMLAFVLSVALTGSIAAAETTERVQLVFEYQDGRISEQFESTLEALFPVDIVMDKVLSTNPYLRLQEELTHGMAPDFVLCEYIRRMEEDILEQYFYDLSAESFVSSYYLSAVESCTTAGGGLYYIPGPSYVYGIVYDKTAFAELGLSVPRSYTEFVQLIQTVDAMGLTGTEPDPHDATKTIEVPVRAFVPTMRWCDMSQMFFTVYNYEDSFRGIANARWLADYQKGEGTMVGHMEAAAQKYLKLFEDGVLSTELWQVIPGYRSRKLYTYHTALMTVESQQAYGFNEFFHQDTPESMHEIGLMPFYTSDEPDSDYLYAIPRSFVGITAQGAQDPAKREAMLQILDYLSTPEGQTLLISGSDYFGFLKNDTALGSDFYADVQETIRAGRIIPTFCFEGDSHGDFVETYMHDATPELVSGSITIEQWLRGADEYRDKALMPSNQDIYGTVTETLLPIQTAYVDALAYLHSMDADIAYVPVAPSYGTQSYFYSGDITDDMIGLVTTETSYYSTAQEASELMYVVVEMTGQQLLEQIIASCDQGQAGLAGAEVVFSLSGEGEGHYVSVQVNGEELDRNRTYRVAALRGAVLQMPVVQEYPDLTFQKLFKAYLTSIGGTVSAPEQLTIVE